MITERNPENAEEILPSSFRILKIQEQSKALMPGVCFHPAAIDINGYVVELFDHGLPGQISAARKTVRLGGTMKNLVYEEKYKHIELGNRLHGIDDKTHGGK